MRQLKHALLFACFATASRAQIVIGFESLNPAPNSAYTSTAGAPFQVSGVYFNHVHDFGYWIEGFSYTNKYDSTDGTFSNLYGVVPYHGRSQSAVYTVGQTRGVVTLTAPQSTVNGFYVTNTTFASKTIRYGSQYSRKFGDTTGTGSGTTIAQGQYPDYFKLIVHGWKSGLQKPDSAVFFLADYRTSSDVIVGDWQFMNTSSLGAVDSLIFTLRSTDNGQFGMNTPGFFAIDDVQVTLPNPAGVTTARENGFVVWPQPFSESISVRVDGACALRLLDLQGRIVAAAGSADMQAPDGLAPGTYLLEINAANAVHRVKVVKQ